MNRRSIVIILVVVGFIALFSTMKIKTVEEPIVIEENSSLRELTIDDKIKEAQIIVIGELKASNPSKWKFQDQKNVKDASPQEIVDAGGLFTDFIFSVNQIIKGDIATPVIRVRSFYGDTERVQWKNSSEPSYIKGQVYLLFLREDFGPTADIDPGDYISVNSNTAVYQIVDGRAVSADDEWLLEDLIAYIEKSLLGELLVPSESLPLPTETILPPTEAPVLTDTPTSTP